MWWDFVWVRGVGRVGDVVVEEGDEFVLDGFGGGAGDLVTQGVIQGLVRMRIRGMGTAYLLGYDAAG